ncbi:hypothetical protein ABH944_009027 [Caballeronia udeis]|uniref:Uncharacterized protein n=1 Tax=Caballeronia udeis TaxID=1232866 RepID=A0ABW8MZ23_9BURK
MPTFDEKVTHNDTGFGQAEVSAEAIARALGKLGWHVDPTTEEGRLRAAEFINDALSDPMKMDKIIAALDADAPLVSDDSRDNATSDPAKRFIPRTGVGEPTPADYFLMDDEPSRGRLLTALETVGRAKAIKGI